MVWIFNSYENNTSQRILHVPEGRNFVSFVIFSQRRTAMYYYFINCIMPSKTVKCSINIHRVLLCYFTGSCQGTGRTVFLITSSERHDITLLS